MREYGAPDDIYGVCAEKYLKSIGVSREQLDKIRVIPLEK